MDKWDRARPCGYRVTRSAMPRRASPQRCTTSTITPIVRSPPRNLSTPVSWRQGPGFVASAPRPTSPAPRAPPRDCTPARRRLPCDGAHEVRQEGRDTEEEECGQKERAERANQAHGEFFGACLRVDQARASLP